MIEINLVQLTDRFSKAGKVIARKRVESQNVMDDILKFIQEHVDDICIACRNTDFCTDLKNTQSLSYDELQAVRYVLSGLGWDVIVLKVATTEVNSEGISTEGQAEYNITTPDDLFGSTVKVTVTGEPEMSKLYERIQEITGAFKSGPAQYDHEMDNLIQTISNLEKVQGYAPQSLVARLGDILNFCGISVYVLY